MTIKHRNLKASAAARALAALALLIVVGSPFFTSAARAADPYDQNPEKRVETLEREPNIMENDSKGKNVETTDVPTFVRASANVQQLIFSSELRFRNEYSVIDN